MLHRLALFTLFCTTAFACRNDFTLEGDFRDIPTAYAYFDAADDAHFVRVQKAFLEAGGNAVDNAGIADSIYYGPEEATVILRNATTGQEAVMDRVDVRTLGINRTDGIFATEPNIAYMTRADEVRLRPGDEADIRIERPGEAAATATTTMLEPLEIIRPGSQARVDNPSRPLIMSWRRGPEASVYDIRVIFNIRELYPADASRNRDLQLVWQVASSYIPGDDATATQVRFEVDPQGFYRFLQTALPVEGDVVRRFQDFDVEVTAAGPEVLALRTLQDANTGITSSGALPRFTSLVGGIGLITSMTRALRQGVAFDDNSIDSLRDGQFTRALGFR